MTTNVPSIQWTPTGIVLPAETAILTGTQEDMNSAFGGNLNPNLETPQGQMATSLSAIIADKNSQIAYITNQVDPSYAAGRFQDAIGRIYFIDRIAATGTVVIATCIGLFGTIIPVGALAADTSGNLYSCSQAGTIPISGNINLEFTCLTTGPIACPIGALNKIYQSIPGWDSISNSTAGTVGNNVESRAAFEARRKASVALNAQGSADAVYAAVLNVPGVIDAYVYQNKTGSPITYGSTSYTLVAHSIYVAATGGLAANVAQAIFNKLNIGCNDNGNTSVTVTDTSGYNYPYPTYVVLFEIPVSLPIKFAVTIQNNPNLPSNLTTLVQNAIVSAFNGTDGGTRSRIGSTIVAGRFYAGVAAVSPYCNVEEILLGTSTPTLTSVAVGIDQQPTIATSDISVTLV